MTLSAFIKLVKLSSEWFSGVPYYTHRSFIILYWNLISRSKLVAQMVYNHVTWIGALDIELPMHKGGLEGMELLRFENIR